MPKILLKIAISRENHQNYYEKWFCTCSISSTKLKIIKPANWNKWGQIGSKAGLLVPQDWVIKYFVWKIDFQYWYSYILFGMNGF